MSYTPPVIKKAPRAGPAGAAEAEGVRRRGQVLRGAKGLRQLLLQQARTRPRAGRAEEAGRLLEPRAGDWVWTGTYDREGRAGDFLLKLDEVQDPADPKATHMPVVTVQLGLTDYKLEPLKEGLDDRRPDRAAVHRRADDGPLPVQAVPDARAEGLRGRQV